METIEKGEYQKALEDRRILIVGCKFTRMGWTQFRVYLIRDNELLRIDVPQATYYSQKDWLYKCHAWGTDRRLEVILSIGYALGLTSHEMKQNYQWLQDTYNK